MKRVMKTAVAVTAFGLAAALAVPAQAQAGDLGASPTKRDQARIGDDSPLDGLVGGLAGGLLDGLFGAAAKASAKPAQNQTRPQGRPGIDGLSNTLPLDGLAASRPAKPRAQVKPTQEDTFEGAFAQVAYLFEGSLGGATASLSTTRMVPGGRYGSTEALDGATSALDGATTGVAHLSLQETVVGMSRAAKQALPRSSNGRLAPLVGRVAPAETAPLLESLPGTTQVASIDEIAPLVEDASALVSTNGTKATSAYTDTVAALGWTTAALTSMVRDPWHYR
ncbi:MULTISPECIES: hypothetical protein [Nonomuraea]|uniref:DUF4439 domain-containing protein n=1 Tax=Nonomuraea ferruginea TaxID=46174 RepID=A0ABT4TAI4_9ACTN|nr:hypothetical protein [Nonomuraea ferruginea]MDA0646513.1 hypothetical protein [Nonomuraea ferruginea]